MDNSSVDLKKVAVDQSLSSLQKYGLIAVGDTSFFSLIRYEIILFFASGLSGLPGYALRRLLYPFLFASMGKNVSIGRHVAIRGAKKIRIGNNVMIDDNCVLDARGEGTEIVLDDNVLVSGNTVIRARNASLRIGSRCSIGRSCLLGTDHSLELGEEVLLGAYTYLCAGGVHRFNGRETSVLCQGVEQSKGIVIGDGAWLGTRTTVLDGVQIGKGSVVGAHSLVNNSLPGMVVAYGSPAKVVRKRGTGE